MICFVPSHQKRENVLHVLYSETASCKLHAKKMEAQIPVGQLALVW